MTAPARDDDSAVALQYDITAIICAAFSLDEALASHLAEAITHGIRARMGGEYHYIPAPDKRARDEAIRREFNGTNLAEVSRKYRLSRTRIYEIAGAAPRTST